MLIIYSNRKNNWSSRRFFGDRLHLEQQKILPSPVTAPGRLSPCVPNPDACSGRASLSATPSVPSATGATEDFAFSGDSSWHGSYRSSSTPTRDDRPMNPATSAGVNSRAPLIEVERYVRVRIPSPSSHNPCASLL